MSIGCVTEGRNSYKSFQQDSRIPNPLVRGASSFEVASWAEATKKAANILFQAKEEHGPAAIAAIVGAKATNEEAFLVSRLLKEQVGTTHIAGLSWSPADAFHDDFLIHADKNPNTQGLKSLGLLNGGGEAEAVLSAVENGTVKVVLVFGADLVTTFGQERIDKALSDATVILLDTDYNDTTEYAYVVLPIGAAPETDGTCTNHAGRVQRPLSSISTTGRSQSRLGGPCPAQYPAGRSRLGFHFRCVWRVDQNRPGLCGSHLRQDWFPGGSLS